MTTQPTIPPIITMTAQWTAAGAGALNSWIVKAVRLLTGGIRVDPHCYADIVEVLFTGGVSPTGIVPRVRVVTPPVGLVPLVMRDLTDPTKLLVTPTIQWVIGRDGRAQITSLDAVTGAALVTGHIYSLRLYVIGG